MCEILKTTPKGEADGRLQAMRTISVSYVSERFGHRETGNIKKPYNKKSKATKIQQLQQELKILKKQYKVASEVEYQPLAEL